MKWVMEELRPVSLVPAFFCSHRRWGHSCSSVQSPWFQTPLALQMAVVAVFTNPPVGNGGQGRTLTNKV